jgi:hypothetical protein
MSKGVALLLRSKYPCCGGNTRFRATFFVPKETYSRTCPRCGARYEVERATLKQTERWDVCGRIDKLDWTRVSGGNRIKAGSESFSNAWDKQLS